MRRRALLLAALAIPVPAAADPLVIAKSSAVVADQVNAANPKALPGATVDYAVRVSNPNGALSGNTVHGVAIEDALPSSVVLRVADYGLAGSGPVEFSDGNLLGLGLVGSGLGYSYSGLASTADGLEFSDGSGWNYVPRPDADGYDSAVRAVRVRLTGSQAAASTFRLRYRVRLR